jgi:2-iminobutanoate/2-iminopropanoate deaminase
MEIIPYDPPRTYARASRVGDLIFIAGEVGRDDHGRLVSGGIVEQTTRVFENIGDTLSTLGLGFHSLVRMDVFLLEEADVHPFLDVMKRYLPNGSPPGAMLCVKAFSHEGMLVEVECIAAATART